MVQRSSTHIVRSERCMEVGLGDLFSERARRSWDDNRREADLMFLLPYGILHQFQFPAYAGREGKGRRVLRRSGKGGLLARLGRRR